MLPSKTLKHVSHILWARASSSRNPEVRLVCRARWDAGCRRLVTAAEKRSPGSSRLWRRPRAVGSAGIPGCRRGLAQSRASLHESLMKSWREEGERSGGGWEEEEEVGFWKWAARRPQSCNTGETTNGKQKELSQKRTALMHAFIATGTRRTQHVYEYYW